jgi:hypothetical protein
MQDQQDPPFRTRLASVMAGYGSGGAADADELRQKEFVRPCAEDFEGLLLLARAAPDPSG